jgi:hypothetical protein
MGTMLARAIRQLERLTIHRQFPLTRRRWAAYGLEPDMITWFVLVGSRRGPLTQPRPRFAKVRIFAED